MNTRMKDKAQPGMCVAEAYLAALKDHGVDYVFANAGTDFAPIIEGLVRSNDAGRDIPKFITVPHENVAMAMAQGYYKVSGEVAGVMVHVTVGTANALCGLMNAARDNVPVLLAAGRTPVTEGGDPGSRDVPIHWGQESFDQGSTVREYVKWDYELRAGQPVDQVVGRALDVARSAPTGPVYLTLPREVLGAASEDAPPRRRNGAQRPIPAAPSAAAIEQVADAVAAAENPLILTGHNLNTAESFAALSSLAEEHAIPVGQVAGGNLPSSHPMNMGMVPRPLLQNADLILVFDAPVPWMPSKVQLNPKATVISIGPDPFHQRYPFRGMQTDMTVAGDCTLAYAMLRDALRGKLRNKQAAVDGRRKRAAEFRAQIEQQRAKTLEEARTMSPIHPAWLAHCLNQVKNDNAIVISELGVPPDYLSLEQPGCYLPGGGAGGLGRGLGEALGAKVAAPDRQVIAAVGDGSYMFCVPTAAHFVGRAESLPTLTLIANNSLWYAVKGAALGMYPDGRASKANRLPLTELSPSPAFEKTIEACGGRGEKVEDPAKLTGALERSFKAMDDGQQALLNVICRNRARP